MKKLKTNRYLILAILFTFVGIYFLAIGEWGFAAVEILGTAFCYKVAYDYHQKQKAEDQEKNG